MRTCKCDFVLLVTRGEGGVVVVGDRVAMGECAGEGCASY